MFRLLRVVLILYVTIILQTTLAPVIQVSGVRPDFLFLIVLLVALHEGTAAGAIAAFVAGLFVDLNSVSALGITSLANSLIAFGVGSIADRLVRSSLVTRFALALLATALRDQIVVIFTMADSFGDGLRLLVQSSLPGGLYTALLAGPVMAIAERFIGWEKETKRGFR